MNKYITLLVLSCLIVAISVVAYIRSHSGKLRIEVFAGREDSAGDKPSISKLWLWPQPNCRAEERTDNPALWDSSGTALIIGANKGKTLNDPSWGMLMKRTRMDKVFVEPIPSLYNKLVHNLADMPRAKAVNAAIAEKAGNMTMYCLGMNLTSGNKFDKQTSGQSIQGLHKYIKKWWTQLCSLSRDRFFSKYDIGNDHSESKVAQLTANLVSTIQVPTMTVEQLLKGHAPSPVRYVQIDIEGFDHQVVKQLPLESESFRPTLITYECTIITDEQNSESVKRLQSFGYKTCRDKENVVAILRT